MSRLFSYHDIDIYDKEKQFYCDGQWLNDVCIHFSLKYFQNEVLGKLQLHQIPSRSIYFFDPAIVSFLNLQVEEQDEYDELRSDLAIPVNSCLFVPINDNDSFAGSSSHWSLLVCDLTSNEAFHLDSSNNYNATAASRILRKLGNMLNVSFTLKVPKVPMQSNGYDCGIYAILYAQVLSRGLLESNPRSCWTKEIENTIKEKVTPQTALAYRQSMIQLIDHLSIH